MTQEEILDYNKRCALFLGWKETTEQFKIDWAGCKTKERLDRLDKQYIPILEKNGDILFPDFNMTNFYEDWNQIMEVVETIEKLPEHYTTSIHSDVLDKGDEHKMFIFNNEGEIIIGENGKTKKEAVVQAINQFLIWYDNANKQKDNSRT